MPNSRWKAGYAVLALLGVAYGIVVLRGPHGIPGLKDKRTQIRQLDKENDSLLREIEETRRRIRALRDNRDQQELEVRRRLGLVHENETDFMLQDQNKEGRR